VTPRTGETRKPVLTKNGEFALTFIGHSSFFLQTGGKSILIDPNFAKWLFVLKRLRHPGLHIRDLPAIDLVLVTHAHFDHLHRPSLRAIARHTERLGGRAPSIILPRNVTDLVNDLGFREIVELRWWETCDFDGLKITHVPSRHWGARIISNTKKENQRAYGGYVIRSAHDSLYHAGDTAYFEGFREIGRRLHPELALLPIGAYNPPAFRANHTSPEDAVRAFVDLGARWMVPMHYGSFRLSHEPIDEPLKLLAREAKRAGVQDRVRVLPEGVTAFF
jgi:L-ascorbate metabolism protein UlaG (beta-lactamase superfamily)